MLAGKLCRWDFWHRHKNKISLGLHAAAILVFIASLQPYAAALLFVFMFSALIFIYPSTMMEITYDLGMDSASISFAETAAKAQIFFQPADNARIPGWMQLHYRLMFDDAGYARMYVFNTCKNFIRTITTLEYDPHREGDLATKGEDHAADEARYFCQLRKVTPLVPEEKDEPAWGSDPLDQFVRRMDRR